MDQVAKYIGTVGGIGFSPKAPGTVGTAAALLVTLVWAPPLWLVALLLAVGVWSSQRCEKVFQEKDSGRVVIDEFACFFIAAWHLPHLYLVPSFVLFRILDITKPGFLKKLQDLPGGLGVMADDAAAALITNALVQMARIYLEQSLGR